MKRCIKRIGFPPAAYRCRDQIGMRRRCPSEAAARSYRHTAVSLETGLQRARRNKSAATVIGDHEIPRRRLHGRSRSWPAGMEMGIRSSGEAHNRPSHDQGSGHRGGGARDRSYVSPPKIAVGSDRASGLASRAPASNERLGQKSGIRHVLPRGVTSDRAGRPRCFALGPSHIGSPTRDVVRTNTRRA